MDYEQKYKEMKARVLAMGRGYVKGLDYSKPRQIAEYIDPELKEESEDERIMKELKHYLEVKRCQTNDDEEYISCNHFLAWLEKQGESDETKAKTFLINKGYPIDANGIFPTYEEMYNIIKEGLEKQGEFADKVEPKFHKGEWILNNVCLPVKIDSIEDGMYIFTDGDALSVSFVDETYHLWTIEDAMDGDVLAAEDKVFLYNGKLDLRGRACAYCGIYTTYDGLLFTKCAIGNYFTDKEPYPATKAQRDTLFAEMREAGYELDAEKKELKKIGRKPVEKIEPKPIEDVNGEDYGIDGLYHAKEILEKTLGNVEGYQSDDGILEHKCAISAVKELSERKPVEWSEEDSYMLAQAIKCVNNSGKLDVSTEEIEDWLRNLNPQPRQGWSEEDEKMKLRTIELIAKYWNSLPDTDCAENEISESCYNWLQSLRTHPHWKPSKEEIEALEMATDALKIYTSYVPLVSLCSELKKL